MGNELKDAARAAQGLPPGKVLCFVSKKVVDVSETVELVFNGVHVRVHRRYLPQRSDPAPVP